jgi:uncharacterized membrane protein
MKALIIIFAIALHPVNQYFQGPLSIVMNAVAIFVIPGLLVSSYFSKALSSAARALYTVLVSISIAFFLACAANAYAAIVDQKLSGLYAEALTQATLVLLVMLRPKGALRLREIRLPVFDFGKAVYAVGLLLLPGAAVASALRLNQLSDSGWSTVVVCVVVLLAGLVLTVTRLWFPEFTIYSIALTLVLLGSVRGDFLSGTDMSTELYLANLVATNGYWLPSLSNDAYNSALSVTILPNYLGNLFHADNATIFRFLIPALYSLVPVLVFSFFERHRSKAFGVVGALVYVSQPAFVVWSPVPARQMIAILFFAALIFVAFDRRIEKLAREILTFSFGVMMVLSHYSTTYLSIPVLILGTALAFCMRIRRSDGNQLPVLTWRALGGWLDRNRTPKRQNLDSGVAEVYRRLKSNFHLTKTDKTPLMTLRTLAGLAAFTLFWYGPVTHVGDGLQRRLEKSAGEISSGMWNLLGTSGYAAGTSLAYQLGLSNEGHDRESVFKDYRFEVFDFVEINKLEPIEPQTWNNNPESDPLVLSAVESTPIGVFVATLEKTLKNLLRLFLVVGLSVYLVSALRRRLDAIGSFALAAGIALALVVVIPGASIEYDLGRTTQQLLPLLGFAIVSGATALGAALTLKRVKAASLNVALGSLLIGLLMSSTGLINRLTGVTNPTMMLSNSGEMYEQIYVHSQELSAARWLLVHQSPNSKVQSGYFGGTRLPIVGIQRPTLRHVFAWSVDKDNYLFRGNYEVENEKTQTYFLGQYFTYKYPSKEIENHKGIIYTNGYSEIYK